MKSKLGKIYPYLKAIFHTLLKLFKHLGIGYDEDASGEQDFVAYDYIKAADDLVDKFLED